ncbi:MAG: NIPSNAP family protein [Pirellulaceae bacterium]|nr:NIPSNAP family protein [Pirellulaceae bacterium]
MKRRTFLQSTLTAGCLPFLTRSPLLAAEGDREPRQFLEWRRYVCKDQRQHDLVLSFLSKALFPALEKSAAKPVGAFVDVDASKDLAIYTLMPFDSLQQYLELPEQLMARSSFAQAAQPYLTTEKSSPAYERIESSLMISFSGMPRVEIPRTGERIFELRIYESHNELKAALKVEMFNEAELDIFRKVGLDAVFFGQSLFGPDLPNLTYMLGYKDMEEHGAAWKAFLDHPDWKVLKANERYKDTVSKIRNRFLRPTDFSQI